MTLHELTTDSIRQVSGRTPFRISFESNAMLAKHSFVGMCRMWCKPLTQSTTNGSYRLITINEAILRCVQSMTNAEDNSIDIDFTENGAEEKSRQLVATNGYDIHVSSDGMRFATDVNPRTGPQLIISYVTTGFQRVRQTLIRIGYKFWVLVVSNGQSMDVVVLVVLRPRDDDHSVNGNHFC